MGVPSLNDLAVDGTLNTTNKSINQFFDMKIYNKFTLSEKICRVSVKL